MVHPLKGLLSERPMIIPAGAAIPEIIALPRPPDAHAERCDRSTASGYFAEERRSTSAFRNEPSPDARCAFLARRT